MAFILPEFEKWLAEVAEHDRPHVAKTGRAEAWKHHLIKLNEAFHVLEDVLYETEMNARILYASEHGEDGWGWNEEIEGRFVGTMASFIVSVLSMFHTFEEVSIEEIIEIASAENRKLAKEMTTRRETMGSLPDFLKQLLGDNIEIITGEEDPSVDADGVITNPGKGFNV